MNRPWLIKQLRQTVATFEYAELTPALLCPIGATSSPVTPRPAHFMKQTPASEPVKHKAPTFTGLSFRQSIEKSLVITWLLSTRGSPPELLPREITDGYGLHAADRFNCAHARHSRVRSGSQQ
jgi:hypothetical protein